MNDNEAPRPKPHPPLTKSQIMGVGKAVKEAGITNKEAAKQLREGTASLPKPKFVRKPHLTARPFKDNEELAKLQKSMENTTKKTTPRRGQRRNNKESK